MSKEVLRVGCVLALLMIGAACAATPPEPFGPVPSAGQLRWHELEYYCRFQ